ncbi:uncharacterized protein LOC124308940 [Neodiprion virginianus]|uniref:uncharacterized protein LOC124308940 n=1 Tax=Neodiprion virginianus TaxID=2961670 RepID=UPI001EE72C30|nr:uncharacterized protein LOC124308940 [Neodiprion virginianus]
MSWNEECSVMLDENHLGTVINSTTSRVSSRNENTRTRHRGYPNETRYAETPLKIRTVLRYIPAGKRGGEYARCETSATRTIRTAGAHLVYPNLRSGMEYPRRFDIRCTLHVAERDQEEKYSQGPTARANKYRRIFHRIRLNSDEPSNSRTNCEFNRLLDILCHVRLFLYERCINSNGLNS